MVRVLQPAEEGIPFMELLLDERICQGQIKISQDLVKKVGGINRRLKAKQKYELILRIAADMNVVFLQEEEGAGQDDYLLEDDETTALQLYGWETDCYIIGRYSNKLKERGYFDAAVGSVIEMAEEMGKTQEVIAYLEQMVARRAAYYRIEEDTSPILIYMGDTVCHNVLTVIAEQFGAALECKGENVVYFDVEKEDIGALMCYTNRTFKAIIGVQSYMFAVKMRDEIHYLHEYIYGPKYNFIFDHPIWMKKFCCHQYPDFHVLTHDMNYVNFTKRYLKQDAILFPPAGIQGVEIEAVERDYDLTFVGTWGDYMEQVLWIHQLERETRFLANRLMLVMRKNPNMTPEDAFAVVLEKKNIRLSDEEFVQRFHELRRVIYCVMHYYRNKVIETILLSGMQIDVFGDSWQHSPLRRYPNLVCHPDVTVEESINVWKKSKLSLNVMSWHKGGFTERMAGIMLAEAVLVTDDTTYLRGRYDANDMIVFRLENLAELPDKIKYALEDTDYRKCMARHGREKTEQRHTWKKRAEQFLEMLQQE